MRRGAALALPVALALGACAGPGGAPPVPAPVAAAPAESLGFDSAALAAIPAYLDSEVDVAFPGAVVAVGRHGRVALLAAVGHLAAGNPSPVTPNTFYDLASLTKVIGLTTACMILVDEGRLDLDAPIARYVPEFLGPGKSAVTVRHLLTHSSGLPAWRPLYREAATRQAAFALVDTTPLDTTPGARFVYSDLGAILLTQAVERITGERLDRFLARRVFGPLGMTRTRYRPPRAWRPDIAPTEVDTVFRHELVWGEVHDENAWRMDRVSGHAGLFSTAPDLARFAAWILARRAGTGPDPVGVAAATVRAFTTRQDLPPGSSRAIGWDTPSQPSSAGTRMSPDAFGHTGFTGTSIWMDPDRDLFVILLTNRVNPTRANNRLGAVRPHVADLAVLALSHPER